MKSSIKHYKDTMKENHNAIDSQNYEIARKIYVFTLIVLLMYCVSSLFSQTLSRLKLFYMISSLVVLIEYICHITIVRKHRKLAGLSNTVLISTVLLFGLLLGTIFANDSLSAMFMIIMVGVPVCFIEDYFKLFSITTLFSVAFIVIASFTVSPKILSSDVANLIASWFISQFLTINILNLRLNELVLTSQYLSDSKFDELTHLPNRRSLNNEMLKVNNDCIVHKSKLAVAMIDIDNFKLYNDKYGHIVGDVCLEQLSELFKHICDSLDVFVSRYGGEEFVAIMVDKTQEEVLEICETLRKSVENSRIEHGENAGGFVTISIGYAIKENADETAFDLLDRADEALYEAKNSGRNKVCQNKMQE